MKKSFTNEKKYSGFSDEYKKKIKKINERMKNQKIKHLENIVINIKNKLIKNKTFSIDKLKQLFDEKLKLLIILTIN